MLLNFILLKHHLILPRIQTLLFSRWRTAERLLLDCVARHLSNQSRTSSSASSLQSIWVVHRGLRRSPVPYIVSQCSPLIKSQVCSSLWILCPRGSVWLSKQSIAQSVIKAKQPEESRSTWQTDNERPLKSRTRRGFTQPLFLPLWRGKCVDNC